MLFPHFNTNMTNINFMQIRKLFKRFSQMIHPSNDGYIPYYSTHLLNDLLSFSDILKVLRAYHIKEVNEFIIK